MTGDTPAAGPVGPVGRPGAERRRHRSAAGAPADAPDSVRSSAAKPLTVLAAPAGAGGTAADMTELALDVGLPKSTTHRLLEVLEERGLVSRAGPLYRIGGSFLELTEVARWSDHAALRDAATDPSSGRSSAPRPSPSTWACCTAARSATSTS